jgi:uncharacterized membrane protein YfcA
MLHALDLDLIIFLSASFLGALVAGLAGFAFGLIASAIWLHVITPAHSAALVAAFAIIIQGYAIWKLRHALVFTRLLPFIVGGAIGIPIGAQILFWVSVQHMRAAIGLLLVLFSLYALLRPTLLRSQGGKVADGLVGVASGIVGASTGLAGVPIIVWAAIRGWSKDEQRSVFQPVLVAIFAMTLVWFGGSGTLSADFARLFLLGLPAVVAGSWLGLKLYGTLNEARFRSLVLVLLLISGLALLPSAFEADAR